MAMLWLRPEFLREGKDEEGLSSSWPKLVHSGSLAIPGGVGRGYVLSSPQPDPEHLLPAWREGGRKQEHWLLIPLVT